VNSAFQEQLRLSGAYKTLPFVFLYDVLLKNRDNFLSDETKELYTFQNQRDFGSWFLSVLPTTYLIAEILNIGITYTFVSFKDIQRFQYSLFLQESISGLEWSSRNVLEAEYWKTQNSHRVTEHLLDI